MQVIHVAVVAASNSSTVQPLSSEPLSSELGKTLRVWMDNNINITQHGTKLNCSDNCSCVGLYYECTRLLG